MCGKNPWRCVCQGQFPLRHDPRNNQPEVGDTDPPAMTAGTRKSNISIRLSPMSAATETTRRLVEVPMVVQVPPSRVANPIGISTVEALVLVRMETLIRIGRSRTTTGTLLIKALMKAATSRVSSKETPGLIFHRRARPRPTGSRARFGQRPGRQSSGHKPRPVLRVRNRGKKYRMQNFSIDLKRKSSKPTAREIRMIKLCGLQRKVFPGKQQHGENGKGKHCHGVDLEELEDWSSPFPMASKFKAGSNKRNSPQCDTKRLEPN